MHRVLRGRRRWRVHRRPVGGKPLPCQQQPRMQVDYDGRLVARKGDVELLRRSHDPRSPRRHADDDVKPLPRMIHLPGDLAPRRLGELRL